MRNWLQTVSGGIFKIFILFIKIGCFSRNTAYFSRVERGCKRCQISIYKGVFNRTINNTLFKILLIINKLRFAKEIFSYLIVLNIAFLRNISKLCNDYCVFDNYFKT